MTPATLLANTTPAPTTRAGVLYWSSASENTHRFATHLAALGLDTHRLPNQPPYTLAQAPFVLLCPTFADGEGRGAVPKPVIRFLNIPENRALLRGVVGGGNRNFGAHYIQGAREVARKCGVPVLGDFELAGSRWDAERLLAPIQRALDHSHA